MPDGEVTEKKKLTPYLTGIGMILVAGVVLAWTSWPQKKPVEDRAYFSTDDGKSWYEDSIDLIPPYTHDGKPAVRAMIFTTEKSAKPFCGYLQQFGPSVKPSLDAAVADGAKRQPPVAAHLIAYGIEFSGRAEVKKPGGATWVPVGGAVANTLIRVNSPDGSELDQVMP